MIKRIENKQNRRTSSKVKKRMQLGKLQKTKPQQAKGTPRLQHPKGTQNHNDKEEH